MAESKFVKSPAESAAAYLIDAANRIREGRDRRLRAADKKIPSADSYARVRDKLRYVAIPVLFALAKHKVEGVAATVVETLGGVIGVIADVSASSDEPLKDVYREAHARQEARRSARKKGAN